MRRVFKSHLKGNSVTDNKQIYLLITDNTDNTINGEGLSQMLIELYFHVHCGIKVQAFSNTLSLTSGCLCTASFSNLQIATQLICSFIS